MSNRPYPIVTVNEKAARALRAGHPWVYGAETAGPDGPYENGCLADVVTAKGRWMGTGFLNDHSKIRVRLISRNTNDRFDEGFWRRRVAYALDYRKTVMGEDFPVCRLIFGEADQFPGLTADLFRDILVTEVLSLGMETVKATLYPLLVEELAARGVALRAIYERNEAALREKEGLPREKGFVPLPGLATDLDGHVTITENGIDYDVDYISGQKTGFFLDQKENRKAIWRLCPGADVLDFFTHTGSFGLNAAMAGAAHVLSVDSSALAIEQAKENAALNGLSDRIDYQVADVFALLPELEAQGRQADVVILDPPAFTKSRSSIRAAVRGYREINLRGMRLTRNGGFLVTCSCSHFMDPELFRKTIGEAAHDAHVRLRQVEFRTQAPDHPILWNSEESYYLKFYIFQVVRE